MSEIENQNHSPEQEATPEQLLAQLTNRAKRLLDDNKIPSSAQSDGSVVRLLHPNITMSSTYTNAALKEVTTGVDTPKQYEYSYVLYDRGLEVQVLQWDESATAMVHKVKFAGDSDEDLQTIKDDIQLTAEAESQLEVRLQTLQNSYRNDVISADRITNYDAERSTSRLGRIRKAIGKTILSKE